MEMNNLCEMFIDKGFTKLESEKIINLIKSLFPSDFKEIAEIFLLCRDKGLIVPGNTISEKTEG